MSRTVDVNTGVIAWVDVVMDACIALIRPNGLDRPGFCQPVANCFYNSINEVDKANLAARQASLALWPGIISSITALHPDPGDLVYDNLLWAIIFAATSGGTVGLASEKPRRYLSAPSVEKGRILCLAADAPNMTQVRRRGRRFHALTHGVLTLVLGFYILFLGVYLKTLNRTILTWSCSPYWLGSLWYWVASLPALIQAVHRLLVNNVTLFEGVVESTHRQSEATKEGNSDNSKPTTGLLAPPGDGFVEYKSSNSVLIWTRIFANQLRNRP